MTDKDLRKLSREDLLQLLLEQGREVQQLREKLAAANMPAAFATSSFSNTASLFHGLIVGTLMPPIAELSLTAVFMTAGSTPSPVKAITP